MICCAYLTDHFTKRYDLLARDVAAALRRNLVFDVNGSDTRCHEFFHRTHHVDGVAKAGIGIGDHRYVDCCCDIARHHDHFSHRGKANIGTSEQRHGHAVTGDTATRESSLLDDACCECVVRARFHQCLTLFQQATQTGCGFFFHGRPRGRDQLR